MNLTNVKTIKLALIVLILYTQFNAVSAIADTNISDTAFRQQSSIATNLTWSPLNFPFPGAKGINAYYVSSADWMFGVDYLSSNIAISILSLEIGEISEKNYTFQAKRFFGDSFNLTLGIGSRSSEIKLAANLFDLVANEYSQTVSKFRTNYIRLGLGNQWRFKKNYTFSVDWFTIDIPFSGEVEVSAAQYADSPESKRDIEYSESILKYYPSGATARLRVGIIF